MSPEPDVSAALIESLPIGILATDPQGRIIVCNAAAAELCGIRRSAKDDQSWDDWRLSLPDGRPLPPDILCRSGAARDGEAAQIDAVCQRPDGRRLPLLVRRSSLRDGSGRMVGILNVLVDVDERTRAEIDLARLAAIVESSDDAIVSKTLEGRITSWNAGAERIFGYTADEMVGAPITRIIPPDLHAEEQTILEKLRRGERISHYETVRIGKSGRRIDISLTVSPLRDKGGRVIGASKIARDISERKQAEALQRLLVEELNHRVKNTLATVQAIATQSLRRARDPHDFIDSFTGRVRSLARAHNLLVETRLQGVDVVDLLREQVLLDGTDDPRVSWSGPGVVLDPQEALHMAMVLHELATNARKYGALSVAEGRLAIGWETTSGRDRQLAMTWQERGGPTVGAPDRRGFGTTLIEQTLRAHAGEARLFYGSGGVTCRIRLPLVDGGHPRIGTYGTTAVVGPAARPVVSRLKDRRILVVEDEPLVAMDIEEALATAGCAIIGPAGNLDDARRLIGEAAFDAALLDVNLSGHPVDDLAMALSQRNIPFVFVTGYGRDALPSGFAQASMLSKPFARDQLLATAEALVSRRDEGPNPALVQRSPG